MTDKQPEIRSDIDKICSAVMADTEALEDAKMTLEIIRKTDPGVYDEMIDDTISLIRRALSASILGAIDNLTKTDQEPVAWMHTTATGDVYFRKKPHDKVFNPQPVYTTPPQREWQGLTDEEYEAIRAAGEFGKGSLRFKNIFNAIEAKLKEKNT
jgi:hypothetical protein